MEIKDIARVAHEINRAYCISLGDDSQKPWDEAPDWQKASCIEGVKFHIKNPYASPEDSHNNWLQEKEKAGWKYGKVKNEKTKKHPCMKPYDELPQSQRSKDYLFKAVVLQLNSGELLT